MGKRRTKQVVSVFVEYDEEKVDKVKSSLGDLSIELNEREGEKRVIVKGLMDEIKLLKGKMQEKMLALENGGVMEGVECDVEDDLSRGIRMFIDGNGIVVREEIIDQLEADI